MEGHFILLLILAIIGASANTLLFKVTLNAFSSPTTNYGFFVSQASTFLYTLQAAAMSLFLLWKSSQSLKSPTKSDVPQRTYIYMGLMDAGSATLGAIAGAYCPGELQTILNQMVIPVTLLGSHLFLSSHFKSYQLWGCTCIVVGACVASSDYFFHPDEQGSNSSGGASGGMTISVAIIVYFLSVLPSAFSNIYKEQQMKVHNMHEVHTSTFVSFYQLWIGFVFLPLLAMPSLGGLSVAQMASQMSDGFTCFMGTNPNDPLDDCSQSAYILLLYIFLNFVYNVLLLVITKRGSAVLLVVSQALSLPLTNIAFTLRPLMGPDVEPLTITDLSGIVLVCIGFLAYSGYGFANNFMVAQGPPGQMAYCHFEDQDQVLVSTKIGRSPEALVHFLVGSFLNAKASSGSGGGYGGGHGYETIGEGSEVDSGADGGDVSALQASERALSMLQDSMEIMTENIHALKEQQNRIAFDRDFSDPRDVDRYREGSDRGEGGRGRHCTQSRKLHGGAAERLQQQYQAVVFNASPRVTTSKSSHHGPAGEQYL